MFRYFCIESRNNKHKSVKNGYLKSRILSEEKNLTPSTNIPLLCIESRNNQKKSVKNGS